MSDSGEESSGGPCAQYGSGRAFPLSSRRLTQAHLRALAQALGLPTDASGDDTRLMVEGKLGEMEKDPRTVQVCTDDPLPDGRATVIGLQDATGLFLKVEKELQRDMEDGERLEYHPLEDDFEHVLLDESVLSDGQTSTRQAELESVLKSYRLELQALKDVLVQERKKSGEKGSNDANAKMVKADSNPLSFLYSSDSEDGGVCLVRVQDKGSKPRTVTVDLQGVPVKGVIDSGADITIMGAEVFKKVASVAHLKKSAFKKPDKVPYTYDGKSFELDGRMDLDVSFDGHTMTTPVYLKMDAKDSLLLSEGVCRQLKIISYHSKVDGEQQSKRKGEQLAAIPAVRVRLVQSLRLLPNRSARVTVQLDGDHIPGEYVLEPSPESGERRMQVDSSLVHIDSGGKATVVITNDSLVTQKAQRGALVGLASEAEVASKEDEEGDDGDVVRLKAVAASDVTNRKRKLGELLAEAGPELPGQERDQLHTLLLTNHEAFAVEEGERGETDLVQMTIDTGDSSPKHQPVRRMPFAVRQQVAEQLKNMQEQGVITHSHSPWASPVVLVRKKDGSVRFCIDYRSLNLVTKADQFPIPRIDDLLDQLGKAKYFSTLDLASGYWQVQMHPDSVEKTAFITHQGLFEFNVMPFGLRNAPSVFQRLMQRVLAGLNPENGPDFVSVYLDDVLVFSETFEEHLHHLALVINRLLKAGLKLRPSKCHFICKQVQYLGHLITPSGILPNPGRTDAVRIYPTPQSVKEVRQFLGLASYYRRFVEGFASIAQPLHNLTRKGALFSWDAECEGAFKTLKEKLVEPPVLAYPDFSKSFVLETDASARGLGAILSQEQEDNRLHPVAYASRALSPQEKRYAITELETLAVVWAVSHFNAYLYGHDVVVYTDHSAVKAVLETPNPNGKHARWWLKIFASGLRTIKIVYKAGKENGNADALSRCPGGNSPTESTVTDVQVAAMHSESMDASELLQIAPAVGGSVGSFSHEQLKDPEILELKDFLSRGIVPTDEHRARKLAAEAPLFAVVDDIVYFLDSKKGSIKRCVVPFHMRETIMEENHGGQMAGHFSGEKLYKLLRRHWWWPRMYTDVVEHCRSCPECAIVNSSGQVNMPPLHPIPVQRVFQIVGVDVMDLPITEAGNKHVVVFQDFLSKYPLVYPVPDQKSIRIARLLVEEVVPLFGVPEALLSDRGTNLLSHLMKDVCEMLGVKKLNTTAYHPQCDGMVERFNRTLKTALRKHAARFGNQWDRYLHGVLWAYRNIPHESTGEKPSYLLFGLDCRSPTEASYLPETPIQLGTVEDYRDELVLCLSSARELAVASIQRAQGRYKANFDRKARDLSWKLGDWVLVLFPHEQTGKNRKLSRPWHGPYRVTAVNDPDITVTKVYFPQDATIQVHQSRVKSCPPNFPSGFYWYGGRRLKRGRPPKWVQDLVEKCMDHHDDHVDTETQRDAADIDDESREDSNTADSHTSNDKGHDRVQSRPCKYPLRSRSGRTF